MCVREGRRRVWGGPPNRPFPPIRILTPPPPSLPGALVPPCAGLVKGAWTPEEDEVVRKLVTKLGTKKWSEIAQALPGRLGKQCRERWYNHLDPAIKRTAWTEEEDRVIITLQHKMGNKWAEIAQEIPGRCVVAWCAPLPTLLPHPPRPNPTLPPFRARAAPTTPSRTAGTARSTAS